ncbi:MAG: hypothetical protein ACR2HY_05005 [Acidimicrobiales bacterium]
MKRALAIVAVAAMVIGGGAAAFAAEGGSAPAPTDGAAGAHPLRDAIKALPADKKAALKTCVKGARDAHKGDKLATHAAVKDCLTKAGIDVAKFAHGLKAVRDQIKALPADKKAALKTCVKGARDAHKGDKTATRDAVKGCLTTAGIKLPTPAG